MLGTGWHALVQNRAHTVLTLFGLHREERTVFGMRRKCQRVLILSQEPQMSFSQVLIASVSRDLHQACRRYVA